MRFEVNIDKKYFFAIVLIGLIFIGIVGVVAYGTYNPPVFGHSVGEINWGETVPSITATNMTVNKITATSFCNATTCSTNLGSGGSTVINNYGSGVNKIINGTGILMTSTGVGGTGNVTISATSSEGQWSTGANIYNLNTGDVAVMKNFLVSKNVTINGNVGIGTSPGVNKLAVNGNAIIMGNVQIGEPVYPYTKVNLTVQGAIYASTIHGGWGVDAFGISAAFMNVTSDLYAESNSWGTCRVVSGQAYLTTTSCVNGEFLTGVTVGPVGSQYKITGYTCCKL